MENSLPDEHSRQFGYPMYAAAVPSVAGINPPQWSDRIDEAHLYDERDNQSTKLTYWRAYASNLGLDPAAISVEAA